jgi:beta-lactamase class A
MSSPVFLHLTGRTEARAVLEAMIAHSDNTATDAALAAVGPSTVRALIGDAGLLRTRIPDSTRRLFSYLAGAPAGLDLGWEAMKSGGLVSSPRTPLNDVQTMASTSAELVRWYKSALRGEFFKESSTLTEFKRISAMADSLPHVLPPNTLGFGKGGSIDWQDFHCFALAGQMIVSDHPVTFSFTINWTGPDETVSPIFGRYKAAVADALRSAAATVRAAG